jgi:hypothetical protein
VALADDDFAEKLLLAPSAAVARKKAVRTFAFVKSVSEIDVVSVISGLPSADLRNSVKRFARTLRAKSIPLPRTDDCGVIAECAGLATNIVATNQQPANGAKKSLIMAIITI